MFFPDTNQINKKVLQKSWKSIKTLIFFIVISPGRTTVSCNLSKIHFTCCSLMCIGMSTPLENTHPLSCQAPLKFANCTSPPLFRWSSLCCYWFLWTHPLKIRFFSEPPKYFSSLIPSYLLKIIKFLVKISQFEFIAMTEKNIFVYKIFCH